MGRKDPRPITTANAALTGRFTAGSGLGGVARGAKHKISAKEDNELARLIRDDQHHQVSLLNPYKAHNGHTTQLSCVDGKVHRATKLKCHNCRHHHCERTGCGVCPTCGCTDFLAETKHVVYPGDLYAIARRSQVSRHA